MSIFNALEARDRNALKEILSYTNTNQLSEDDLSPLMFAAYWGLPDILELLLTSGADLEMENSLGKSALHYAAITDQSKAITILCAKGANPNHADKEGHTPLHRACDWNSKNASKELIKFGANSEMENEFGLSAFDYCHNSKQRDHLQQFSDSNPQPLIEEIISARDGTLATRNTTFIGADTSPSLTSAINQKFSLTCDCDFGEIYSCISEGVNLIVETCISPDEEYLGMDAPVIESTDYCTCEAWRPTRQCCYICHHNVCESSHIEGEDEDRRKEKKYFGDETFKYGTRVVTSRSVNNEGQPHRGTVRYFGLTHLHDGARYVGIELDTASGRHNGTIKGKDGEGVTYFNCPENCGVLVRYDDVSIDEDHPYTQDKKIWHGARVLTTRTKTKDGRVHAGTVWFIGTTHLHKSQRYVGIELDEPLGKHNGTAVDSDGKEYAYFSCSDGHGALVRYDDVVIDEYHPDHIADPRLDDSPICEDVLCCQWLDLISSGASCEDVLHTVVGDCSINPAVLNCMDAPLDCGDVDLTMLNCGEMMNVDGLEMMGKQADTTKQKDRKFVETKKKRGEKKKSITGFNFGRFLGIDGNVTVMKSQFEDEHFQLGNRVTTKLSVNDDGKAHKGVVRYIGKTHVHDDASYIGIELDEALGTNNGSVKDDDGRQYIYFNCRDNNGVIVRYDDVAIDSEHPDTKDSTFKHGTRVMTSTTTDRSGMPHRGTVRFVGTTYLHKTQRYVGIELDEALGRHNGTSRGFDGKQYTYFSCPEWHGVLVRYDDVAVDTGWYEHPDRVKVQGDECFGFKVQDLFDACHKWMDDTCHVQEINEGYQNYMSENCHEVNEMCSTVVGSCSVAISALNPTNWPKCTDCLPDFSDWPDAPIDCGEIPNCDNVDCVDIPALNDLNCGVDIPSLNHLHCGEQGDASDKAKYKIFSSKKKDSKKVEESKTTLIKFGKIFGIVGAQTYMEPNFEDESFQLGNRVTTFSTVSDDGMSHKGVVRYVGKSHLDDLDDHYVGIELDEELGYNDGSTKDSEGNEYYYFHCPDNHGLIVRYDDVAIDSEHPDTKDSTFKHGTRVMTSTTTDQSGMPHRGTVRFVGTTYLHKTQRYVGIELDEALGRHNGTTKGPDGKQYTYFSCPDRHGVLVRYDDVVVDVDHPDHSEIINCCGWEVENYLSYSIRSTFLACDYAYNATVDQASGIAESCCDCVNCSNASCTKCLECPKSVKYPEIFGDVDLCEVVACQTCGEMRYPCFENPCPEDIEHVLPECPDVSLDCTDTGIECVVPDCSEDAAEEAAYASERKEAPSITSVRETKTKKTKKPKVISFNWAKILGMQREQPSLALNIDGEDKEILHHSEGIGAHNYHRGKKHHHYRQGTQNVTEECTESCDEEECCDSCLEESDACIVSTVDSIGAATESICGCKCECNDSCCNSHDCRESCYSGCDSILQTFFCGFYSCDHIHSCMEATSAVVVSSCQYVDDKVFCGHCGCKSESCNCDWDCGYSYCVDACGNVSESCARCCENTYKSIEDCCTATIEGIANCCHTSVTCNDKCDPTCNNCVCCSDCPQISCNGCGNCLCDCCNCSCVDNCGCPCCDDCGKCICGGFCCVEDEEVIIEEVESSDYTTDSETGEKIKASVKQMNKPKRFSLNWFNKKAKKLVNRTVESFGGKVTDKNAYSLDSIREDGSHEHLEGGDELDEILDSSIKHRHSYDDCNFCCCCPVCCSARVCFASCGCAECVDECLTCIFDCVTETCYYIFSILTCGLCCLCQPKGCEDCCECCSYCGCDSGGEDAYIDEDGDKTMWQPEARQTVAFPNAKQEEQYHISRNLKKGWDYTKVKKLSKKADDTGEDEDCYCCCPWGGDIDIDPIVENGDTADDTEWHPIKKQTLDIPTEVTETKRVLRKDVSRGWDYTTKEEDKETFWNPIEKQTLDVPTAKDVYKATLMNDLKDGWNYNDKNARHLKAKWMKDKQVPTMELRGKDVEEDRETLRLGMRAREAEPEADGTIRRGTVRYIGYLKLAGISDKLKYVGLELDEPLGNHDGSLRDANGVRNTYFRCYNKHGVFFRRDDVVEEDEYIPYFLYNERDWEGCWEDQVTFCGDWWSSLCTSFSSWNRHPCQGTRDWLCNGHHTCIGWCCNDTMESRDDFGCECMNQSLLPCLNVANDGMNSLVYEPSGDDPICYDCFSRFCPSDPVHLLPRDDCKDPYEWLMAFGRDVERLFGACGHGIHQSWSYLWKVCADPSNTLFKSLQECIPEDDERLFVDEALMEQEAGVSDDKREKIIEVTAQENRMNIFNQRMTKSATRLTSAVGNVVDSWVVAPATRTIDRYIVQPTQDCIDDNKTSCRLDFDCAGADDFIDKFDTHARDFQQSLIQSIDSLRNQARDDTLTPEVELLDLLKERKAIIELENDKAIGYLTKSKQRERDARIARKSVVEADIIRVEKTIREGGSKGRVRRQDALEEYTNECSMYQDACNDMMTPILNYIYSCIPSKFDLFEVACGDDGDVYLMPNDILPHEDEMKAEILDGNDDNNVKGRKNLSSMPATVGGGNKKPRMKQRRSSYTAEKPYGV